VKINIPHMLIGLREMQQHQPKSKSRWERLAYRLAEVAGVVSGSGYKRRHAALPAALTAHCSRRRV
jgi:hypothetical protein